VISDFAPPSGASGNVPTLKNFVIIFPSLDDQDR
jgi:hypothetical protein